PTPTTRRRIVGSACLTCWRRDTGSRRHYWGAVCMRQAAISSRRACRACSRIWTAMRCSTSRNGRNKIEAKSKPPSLPSLRRPCLVLYHSSDDVLDVARERLDRGDPSQRRFGLAAAPGLQRAPALECRQQSGCDLRILGIEIGHG